MGSEKISVFQSIVHFFASGALVIVKPRRFFATYDVLVGKKRWSFLYMVLYEWLGLLVYLFAIAAVVDLGLSQFSISGAVSYFPFALFPTWLLMLSAFVWLPFGLLVSIVIWTLILLFISWISGTEFRFRPIFNLLCAIGGPYSLGAGIFWVLMIYPSILAFSGHAIFLTLLLGFVCVFLSLLFLVLFIRSFHNGACVMLEAKLMQDPQALYRFYWTLTIVSVFLCLLGIFLPLLFFKVLLGV